MAPTSNNPSYDRSVHKYPPWSHLRDSCNMKFRDELQIGGGECKGSKNTCIYIHFYCHVEEAGFYSDVVECLPVNQATWVRFSAGIG